jgi:hypothetical protein
MGNTLKKLIDIIFDEPEIKHGLNVFNLPELKGEVYPVNVQGNK